LDRADERFLSQLTRIRDFNSPIDLFLNPQAFELDDDAPEELRAQADDIAAIGDRLFASPSASDQHENPAEGDSDSESPSENAPCETGATQSPPASDAAPPDNPLAAASALAAQHAAAAPPSAGIARSAAEPVRDTAPNTGWAPAPSLFQPVPATIATGKVAAVALQTATQSDAVNEDRAPAEQRESTITELQAVRALETLMRQIRASNSGSKPLEASASPAQNSVGAAHPGGAPAPPAGDSKNAMRGVPLAPLAAVDGRSIASQPAGF
jgi:hypothetical protein